MLDVAAHRAAVHRGALLLERLLEPIVRDAERRLRGEHVRHRRRVQEAARKQRLGRRRRHHRWAGLAGDFIARDALDQDAEAAGPEHELRVVFEADAADALLPELGVEDLDRVPRQLAGEEGAAALRRRPGPRGGRILRGSRWPPRPWPPRRRALAGAAARWRAGRPA